MSENVAPVNIPVSTTTPLKDLGADAPTPVITKSTNIIDSRITRPVSDNDDEIVFKPRVTQPIVKTPVQQTAAPTPSVSSKYEPISSLLANWSDRLDTLKGIITSVNQDNAFQVASDTKEGLAIQLTDMRSTIVKETCSAISAIIKALPEGEVTPFADFFSSKLTAQLNAPITSIAEAAAECSREVIAFTSVEGVSPVITATTTGSPKGVSRATSILKHAVCHATPERATAIREVFESTPEVTSEVASTVFEVVKDAEAAEVPVVVEAAVVEAPAAVPVKEEEQVEVPAAAAITEETVVVEEKKVEEIVEEVVTTPVEEDAIVTAPKTPAAASSPIVEFKTATKATDGDIAEAKRQSVEVPIAPSFTDIETAPVASPKPQTSTPKRQPAVTPVAAASATKTVTAVSTPKSAVRHIDTAPGSAPRSTGPGSARRMNKTPVSSTPKNVRVISAKRSANRNNHSRSVIMPEHPMAHQHSQQGPPPGPAEKPSEPVVVDAPIAPVAAAPMVVADPAVKMYTQAEVDSMLAGFFSAQSVEAMKENIIAECTVECEKLVQDLTEMQSKFESENVARRGLEGLIKETESSFNKLSADSEAQSARDRAEIQRLTTVNTEVENHLRLVEKDYRTVHEKYQKLKQVNENAVKNETILKESLRDVQARLSSSEHAYETMKKETSSRMDTVVGTITELKNSNAKKASEVDALTAELTQLKTAHEEKCTAFDTMSNEKGALDKEFKTVNDEVTQLRSHTSEVDARLKILEAENSFTQTKNVELERLLRETQDREGKTKEENYSYVQQIDQYKQVSATNEQLVATNKTLEADNAQLKIKVYDLSQKLESAPASGAAGVDTSALVKANEELKQQVAMKEIENQEVIKLCDDLMAQLEASRPQA